jgi:cardiolipin synthase
VAVVALLVLQQVLVVVEDRNWPPPPDAITAEQAQGASEDFVAGDPKPHDVGLDYAWTTAATIAPWAEGTAFFPRIVADIERAQSSVHILMFGWNDSEIGVEMAELVAAKIAEGVEVRILVDSYGAGPTGRHEKLFRDLEAAGAEIVVNDVLPVDEDGPLYGRLFDWRQDEVGRADHRKLYVIDGVVAWTGGAGIESHFANGKFHDVMVRVTGDVVRQAQAVFLTSFASHGASLPAGLGLYFPEQPDPGTIRTALLQVVPGGFVAATQSAREMIDNARRTLDIMNPYFTDKDMIQRTVRAAERGVRVRIVVSEESNNEFATAALRHNYDALLDAGAEIWEMPGTVVHAKLIVADDVVHFGTLNLDAWALYRNFEIAIVAESPEAARLFERRVFGPDIARSSPGEPPSGAGAELKGWLWDKLAYFL